MHEVEEVLGRTVALPWKVKTATGDDWRELYDPGTSAEVARIYAPDVELFGYADRAP